MWAQLISTRLKPGKDQELPKLFDQMKATEQPGSGLVRSMAFRDQKIPPDYSHSSFSRVRRRLEPGSRTHAGRKD